VAGKANVHRIKFCDKSFGMAKSRVQVAVSEADRKRICTIAPSKRSWVSRRHHSDDQQSPEYSGKRTVCAIFLAAGQDLEKKAFSSSTWTKLPRSLAVN